MKTVRKNCFETNSSSTHSITLCTKSDYDKWKDGELYYFDEKLITSEERDKYIRSIIAYNKIEFNWNNKTLTFEGQTISFEDNEACFEIRQKLITPEVLAKITQEEINNFLESGKSNYIPLTYKEYEEQFLTEYESYRENFTTPNGDEVVAFGYYGNDY